ncbi:hypothetical protein V8G54_027458, partial [Vigna mungo]
MDHCSAYSNFSFPYNAQPPRFDMFYEPISEDILQPVNQAFQQQPSAYNQPYHEQPPWPMQQQLPHVYWNQYAEPEHEEFQTEQAWQPTFCDQWQQGIPTYELEGLTTQVAQLVAAVNKLTG